MSFGRPPKLFSDEDCEKMGNDLVEWVMGEGKGEFMFVNWYYDKYKMRLGDWKSLIQRPIFLPYYEAARKKMASNMIKNKEVPQSYGNRYLALYDPDIRAIEKEVMIEKVEADVLVKIDLQKQQDKSPHHDLIAALLTQIKDMRGKLGLPPLTIEDEKKASENIEKNIVSESADKESHQQSRVDV